MKYKIILKTTNKNKNRVHDCLSTWLQGEDFIALTDILTNEFPEISGSLREDYYSAEEKTLFLINITKDTGIFDEYDWLVFIDDDAILNVKMLKYVLPYMKKERVYGLKMHGSYEKAPNTIYPSGGSGYFISPSLIKKHNRMVDNGWGIEDAAVGRWLEQNNITLEDHLEIEGRSCYLKLNGWFPFGDERNLLTSSEQDEPLFSKRILENIINRDQKYKDINSCMTHHYIRWHPLMEYIFNCFQKWTPEDMEQNFKQ